jgi:hypothetical protein
MFPAENVQQLPEIATNLPESWLAGAEMIGPSEAKKRTRTIAEIYRTDVRAWKTSLALKESKQKQLALGSKSGSD